jgi:hypothetical protein
MASTPVLASVKLSNASRDDAMVTCHTHITASTPFVEFEGARVAYRMFANEQGVPILPLSHHRAGWKLGSRGRGRPPSRPPIWLARPSRGTYPGKEHLRCAM